MYINFSYTVTLRINVFGICVLLQNIYYNSGFLCVCSVMFLTMSSKFFSKLV